MLRFLPPWLWVFMTSPLVQRIAQRTAIALVWTLPLLLLDLLASGRFVRLFGWLHEWLTVATVALIIVLAARVAAAVHRWRLGHSDLLELTHSARSILTLACSFVTSPPLPTTSEQELFYTRVARCLANLKRFLLSFVVLALQDCRDELPNGLPVEQLRYLLDETNELSELHRCVRNKPRAAVVELWLRTCVSRAGFSNSDASVAPLLGHPVQVMELHRVISELPLLYDNAVRVWSQPPQWQFLTQYTPRAILVYLVGYTLVRAAAVSYLLVLVGIVSWAVALFALEALACIVESREFMQANDDTNRLDQALLELQDDLDAITHAYFRSNGGLMYWERWNRSLPTWPRRSQRLPRSTSSIAPASPRRSPGSNGPGSRASDGDDGLGKPSLKHILDMITTSPSPSMSTTTAQQGSAAERRPLLPSSLTQMPRYDLFLRRDDEISGDATDSNDEEDEQELDNAFPPV